MERLDELLLAEITEFSLRPTRPLSLQRILSNPDPTEFLHKELPVRFASRIKQLETLPNFHLDSHILHCKNIYTESFKQLRTCNWREEEEFARTLGNLKRRHANIVPILVTGVRNLEERFPEIFDVEYVNKFMNNFFLSRIGTEMLTSQFLAKVHHHKLEGIIDPNCDPMIVIKKASEDAEKICYHQYQRCPKIVIWNRDVHEFPYIPQYLYYILFELLKNSMRAVIEHCHPEMSPHHRLSDDSASLPSVDDSSANLFSPPSSSHSEPKARTASSSSECSEDDSSSLITSPRGDLPVFSSEAGPSKPRPFRAWSASSRSPHWPEAEGPQYESASGAGDMSPIQIILSGDEKEVAIKISDQGGGIPRDCFTKIWSYLYTTAQPVDVEQFRAPSVTRSAPLDAVAATALPKGNVSPLAGFGCGLPLSRLYASYLGGSLQLVSMPHYGTDAYLFLSKIGDTEELIPPSSNFFRTDTTKGNFGSLGSIELERL